MKPILAIALFALVCISHRTQVANASSLYSPNFNLARINSGEQETSKVNFPDATSSENSSDDSSENSSGSSSESSSGTSSDTGSGTSDGTSSGTGSGTSSGTSDAPDAGSGTSSGSTSNPGSGTSSGSSSGTSLSGTGGSSQSGTTSSSDTTSPSDDQGTTSPPKNNGKSSSNTGIIGGIENVATGLMHGVTGTIEEGGHLASEGLSTVKNTAENVADGVAQALIEVGHLVAAIMKTMFSAITTPFNLIRTGCFSPFCIWGYVKNNVLSNLNPFSSNMALSSGKARRSIRSVTDLADPMVSPYNNPMQMLGTLVNEIASAPPKEREQYMQILKSAQCFLSKWFGYGTCTGAGAILNPGLNRPISWQVGMENLMDWFSSHLHYLQDSGMITRASAQYLATLCQTMKNLIYLFSLLQGNQ